jgi:hypothetical protein
VGPSAKDITMTDLAAATRGDSPRTAARAAPKNRRRPAKSLALFDAKTKPT